MLMPNLKLIIVLICTLISFSTSASSECNCKMILQNAILSVEENYALYHIKVPHDNKKLYERYNLVYLEKASILTSPSKCQSLMDDWVTFFQDKHLWVTVDKELTKVKYQKLPLDLKQAKRRWANSNIAKDPIEGLWEMEGYRVAILPDVYKYDIFNGIVVSADNDVFKRGMLKMRLKKSIDGYDMDFYMRDSTMMATRIHFTTAHTLLDDNNIHWRRLSVHDGSPAPPKLSQLTLIDPYKPTLKRIDSTAILFTLPSCSPKYSRVVDSIMLTNHAALEACKLFIVDVRNNGGGSDRTYRSLLPYILTQSLQMPSVGYYMSAENSKMFRELGILNNLDPIDSTARNKIVMAKKSIQSDTFKPLKSPRQVALLTNRFTASSGETFVLKCKQSNKVITFGETTAGCIDGYNGNIIDIGGARLRYPTSIRSMEVIERPIDPFGILPDIPLNARGESIIDFVKSYYNVK